MSRIGDPSYHKLITSPIASLNSLMIQTCSPSIPSTASTSQIPITDLTSSLACSLLTCSIPTATMISPPPPYHAINHHHPHNYHQQLFDIHSKAKIGEFDVDVIGLSQSTKEVSIYDHEVDTDQEDKPLDLSMKNSTSLYSPTTSRPSVIIESPSGRNPSVRRSASSVSSSREHDVHEHFRRSLSGKWPRRSKIDDEKLSIISDVLYPKKNSITGNEKEMQFNKQQNYHHSNSVNINNCDNRYYAKKIVYEIKFDIVERRPLFHLRTL
ncbi:hypothetical protein DICVIV_07071 [Dictyocaulus viviparus]|uniref:Uncharacterized protein n=1 Tax=Dictyocaulus viviparus TaxID=29172 RepID=A0A0D8XSU6_DICVI|nr:hypothetical protein DICVIV_07071 [Dictyocaulus viviparus]